MIHIFNRRALIAATSHQQMHRIQAALISANIPYQTKTSHNAVSESRRHGVPFFRNDVSQPTVFYVKTADYDRAKAAIESAL